MKIKNLYIEAFRGIPKSVQLDFTNKRGEAVSSIIYGDNGTGKSSIIDAIEFNLQARIERSTTINNSRRPSPISKYYTQSIPAKTKIELDDGQVIERGINVTYKDDTVTYKATNNKMNEHFSFVPIALRRNDIMTYNILSKVERQVLFFNFIYLVPTRNVQESNPLLGIDPTIDNLKNECLKLKRQKDYLKKRFSYKIGINPYQLKNISDKESLDLCIQKNVTINNEYHQGVKRVTEKELEEIKRIAKSIVEKQLEIKMIQGEIQQITNASSISSKRLQQNTELLSEASKYLTNAFKSISSVDYVDRIDLIIGDETATSLEIQIKLKNDLTVTPSSIFSEANYDLLILLFYVSIIRVCADKGQAKVFILDDVLQSVDTQIRAKFINYILKEMKDWQFFITAHDRLWLNQLRFIFSNNNFEFKEFQVTNWTFEQGPTIVPQSAKLYDDSLEVAIKSGNTTLMASIAGLMLEKICQNLSIELKIEIKRVKDDKYTIGDLWPGIRKQLKKSKDMESLIESINNSLYIRNLLACHYNEWAIALSDQEVREFAYNIQKLYEKTFCQRCMSWISTQNSSQNAYAECNCHNIFASKTN